MDCFRRGFWRWDYGAIRALTAAEMRAKRRISGKFACRRCNNMLSFYFCSLKGLQWSFDHAASALTWERQRPPSDLHSIEEPMDRSKSSSTSIDLLHGWFGWGVIGYVTTRLAHVFVAGVNHDVPEEHISFGDYEKERRRESHQRWMWLRVRDSATE